MSALHPISSRLAMAMLLSALSLSGLQAEAAPQWKWRDASGSIQYSDRPPPPGTPEQAILSRPFGSTPRPPARAPETAGAPPSGGPVSASAPGKSDNELDARKRKAEEEKKAQQKAEEERQARARDENCQRARAYLRTLQDGIRIARTNAAGEREVLDDAGRAEETQRTQDIIASSCR